jgi:predicted nucleic acid-binding protein
MPRTTLNLEDDVIRVAKGHQQLTAAYLLGLAAHRHGVLATFDRGLRTLAGGTSEFVEIVPTHD